MTRELIKVDKNGTKIFIVRGAKCPRCGGAGRSSAWAETGFICYECNGSGKADITEKEYTEAYLAKLEARRQAKRKNFAKIDEEAEAKKKAEKEAQKIAEEERKIRSQFVGREGEKIDTIVTLEKRSSFERYSYYGYGTETVKVFTFRDEKGNAIVWKTTGKGLKENEGDTLTISATIKRHEEYKGEKQTEVTRLKVL